MKPTSPPTRRVARALRLHRRANKLSRRDLAEIISATTGRPVTRRTLERWEQGIVLPAGDVLCALFDLGILRPIRKGA